MPYRTAVCGRCASVWRRCHWRLVAMERARHAHSIRFLFVSNVYLRRELRCFPQAATEEEPDSTSMDHDVEETEYELMRGQAKEAQHYKDIEGKFKCMVITQSSVLAQASRRMSRPEAAAAAGHTSWAAAGHNKPPRLNVPIFGDDGAPELMFRMTCLCTTCKEAGVDCPAAKGEWLEPKNFFNGTSHSWLLHFCTDTSHSHDRCCWNQRDLSV
eukprot:COSAG04_NODE_4554_length_2020_cov_3.933889_3_plen_214_part_00